MDAKKISISVGVKPLEAARRIAEQEGISLSAVFMRGLEKEIEAEERRRALEDLVRDFPAVSPKRKKEIRASWSRRTKAA